VTRAEILAKVSETFVEMFELEPEQVTAEARLVEDLDLDSIDAIDLAARVQKMTGKRLDEEHLRRIRTVHDVVEIVAEMIDETPSRGGD
jgi:acyl carrier protein